MADPPFPDPKLGVFETMLVIDGRAVELAAHLERMAASLEALFGAEIPAAAGGLVVERARGVELGRLRLTVAPIGEDGLQSEVATARVKAALIFPSPELAIALQSHLLERGLGAHKWADRRLLESAEAAAPAGSIPLLTDRAGNVLEASRANVFAALDGSLLTPPLDAQILPGIARKRAIEVAAEAGIEVREEAVALERLASADEVFLTGSVRGVEPVSSLNGEAFAADGPLSQRISAGLRQRWFSASAPVGAPAPATVPPPGRLAR